MSTPMIKKSVMIIFFSLILCSAVLGLDKLRVVAAEAEIRLNPVPDSPVIVVVTIGTLLENLGKEDGWFQVKFKDATGLEKVGYIQEQSVELMGPKPERPAPQPPAPPPPIEKPEEEKPQPQPVEEKAKEPVIKAEPFAPPFRMFSTGHVCLWGGLSTLGSGDFDEDLKSHDLLYKDLAGYYQDTYFSGSTEGGHSPSHQGLGGGGAFYLGFAKNIFIGLGAEYIANSGKTTQKLNYGWNENSFHNIERTISNKMSALGILLKVKYWLPLNIGFSFVRNIALFIEAGTGLYFASVDYEKAWEGKYEYWAQGYYYDSGGVFRQGWFQYIKGNWTQNDLCQVSKTRLGYSAGLGLEISLTKTIAILIQGKFRALSLGSLTGDETFSYSDTWEEVSQNALGYADQRSWLDFQDSENWTSQGQVYLYNSLSSLLNKSYAFLTGNKDLLDDDPANTNFQEAKAGLSGFAFLIGIKIGIF